MFVVTLAVALGLGAVLPLPAAPTQRPDTVALEMTGAYPFSTGIAVALDTARSIAFVGSGGGVLAIDVSDPTDPAVLSDRIRCLGSVKDLWLDNDRLYVTIFSYSTTYDPSRDVEIWDVGDPANPVLLGGIDFPSPVSAVWARDSIMLASRYLCMSSWDVADPSAPELLDSARVRIAADMIRSMIRWPFSASGAVALKSTISPTRPDSIG